MKSFGALVAAALLSSVAHAVTWSYCGPRDKFITISGVTMTPEAVLPGEILRSTLTGVTNDVLTSGRITLDFPLYNNSEDVCTNGRSCPLAKGSVSLPFTMEVPKAASALAGRSVNGTIKVYDQIDQEVLCLKVDVPIAGKPRNKNEAIEELKKYEGTDPKVEREIMKIIEEKN